MKFSDHIKREQELDDALSPSLIEKILNGDHISESIHLVSITAGDAYGTEGNGGQIIINAGESCLPLDILP